MGRIQPARIIALARQFWDEVTTADLMGVAAEVAFNLLLALFPILLFLAALAGFVGDAAGVDGLFGRILAQLRQIMPASAVETITVPLLEVLSTRSTGLLSLGAVLTLWAASNATASLMKAFNRAYGVTETRPFWLHRLVIAVGLTLLLSVLLLAAFLVLAFGPHISRALIVFLRIDPGVVQAWDYARWPLSALTVLLALGILYAAGPNVPLRVRLLTPGSLAATGCWLLFTFVFQIYIASFANLSATYGTIAGIIILMLWLDYSALVIILGAKLDEFIDARRAEAAMPAGAHPAPLPSATAALTAASALSASASTGRRTANGRSRLPLVMMAVWSLLILIGALRASGRGQ